MADPTRIIAFVGLAGSGKTTAAMHLTNNHGYRRLRFAEPLKAMLRALGLGSEEIDGSLKETPSPLLCGKTPRWAMQTLGTEWGRELIGEDFWQNLWLDRAADCLDLDGRIVADDCRFGTEAATVRRLGGTVVRVTGRGGIAGSHSSELMDFPVDLTIENSGDMRAFLDQVSELTQTTLA
jgi:hypothetical protein